MICAHCGWSFEPEHAFRHVCPEAPGLKGSIEAVVARCPGCEAVVARCPGCEAKDREIARLSSELEQLKDELEYKEEYE